MTPPTYRRTRGPFVTLYRSLDGIETELAHAFGETAHSALDAVQQQDLLMIAESAEGGTASAMKETMIETNTYTLPIYWALYLINGDASGLDDGEQKQIDTWLASRDNPRFVDVGEQYFSWRNDATNLGGDVAEYTAIVQHPLRAGQTLPATKYCYQLEAVTRERDALKATEAEYEDLLPRAANWRNERESLQQRVEALEGCVTICAQTFERYADIHSQKLPSPTRDAKVKANADLAQMCRNYLNQPTG